MINKVFISICINNCINTLFVFGNIYNGTNLLRPYFKFEMSIDYLMDTFYLFHFGANLSYTCKLSIYNTSQKKVILATWWWRRAWLQYIKINHTWNIVQLVGWRIFTIMTIVANTIEKSFILKELVISIIRFIRWLTTWINFQYLNIRSLFFQSQCLPIKFWIIVCKYLIVIATIIDVTKSLIFYSNLYFCSDIYLE